MRGILDLTGRESQVLKQFEGIYSCKLPETEGLTVETWMEAHGVPRFVTPSGNKKGYTPALIAGGFNDAGAALSDADVKALAALPSKNELIGQVVSQLLSPLNDSVSGLANGVSEIVSGLENKAA